VTSKDILPRRFPILAKINTSPVRNTGMLVCLDNSAESVQPERLVEHHAPIGSGEVSRRLQQAEPPLNMDPLRLIPAFSDSLC